GIYFPWTNDPENVSDNFTVQHQTIVPFSAAGDPSGATTLAFLGSATNGNSSGTATIHYYDGSTQTFTLGMTDWTLNGNKAQPAFGNNVVVTMPYRNTRDGQQDLNNYLFFAQVALQKSKTVTTVTLPATIGGTMHIFAHVIQ
ncbi:MAG TPA: hypothetical protein VHZ51_22420, partial [Ktedonobacteraceae bacterium]|nr:hypothetical protein [Ktedonobacteraceae bacterium]